ncbi:MAG: 4-hydroxythreonine-4-phosphate dehydrogenase PdxA [Burkholderiales bacterium]|nr:4-hydroxythreonine-4-phosphate dehydrogenase PdxA [Burkholderiales bacterium]
MATKFSQLAPLALTAGEPAGIGPDLCVLLAQKCRAKPIVAIADRDLLAARARELGLPLRLVEFADESGGEIADEPGELSVLHLPVAETVVAGKLNPANSRYVLRTLQLAADGCASGRFSAMVTAPVQKSVINDAGIPFIGHTEFLAGLTGAQEVVMMLVGGPEGNAQARLRVALATTHLALKDVAAAITKNKIEAVLRILLNDLMRRFGIAQPRILVAALNPHAGESGHLGREEIEVISPVLGKLRGEGFDVRGPLPADTLFNPERLRDADAVLAMYHDQGLPVLKYASFGSGVNVTLGLPIIRTSVDHGAALDLAATGNIHDGSLLAAIGMASELAGNAIAHPSGLAIVNV